MAKRCDLSSQLAAVQAGCSAARCCQVGGCDYASLLAEVQALGKCILCARQDLAALGVHDIIAWHVPAAADELEAVVLHTAAATGVILDVCERLEQAAESTASQDLVNAATARIYEACSFQDITGQRVAKVVRTLQLVEARVQAILLVFGRVDADDVAVDVPTPLLNGPQRRGQAMDQVAIDALLADFE